MGLFEHKEFLNFNDFANYLHDKELGYFNPYENHDIERLKNLINDLFNERKLHPVFYYDGRVKSGFEYDSQCMNFEGYIFVDKDLFKELLNEKLVTLNRNEYFKVCKHWSHETELFEYIFMDTRRHKFVEIIDSTDKPKDLPIILSLLPNSFVTDEERYQRQLKEIMRNGDIEKLKTIQEPQYLQDNINIKFSDLLYLKSDLDKLFNQQPQANNDELAQQLQATIDRQAKEIADLKAQLEQQATQPSDTALDDEMETKSLNAVSRLVYVLLDMAEYDLSTHSGNGNTSIIARSEKLLQKPLSKKFVSDWIKNAQTAKIEYGKK